MMIKAESISKSYGSLAVLTEVSFTINAGEIVSIVGASGAGKTTLLQILGTLDAPDSGTLSINNQLVTQLKPKALAAFRNEHIGFVFQFHNLLPEFTALENVLLPALIQGKNKAKAAIRAEELLEKLGLNARVHHKPNELSGGEKQRVAVARALMNAPSLILADEPSGNLDSKNAEELHQLFFDLRKEFNQTFVIVTHNNELAKMSDRTLRMVDGKLEQ